MAIGVVGTDATLGSYGVGDRRRLAQRGAFYPEGCG